MSEIRLIDANALMNKIGKVLSEHLTIGVVATEIIDAVKDAPTIEPKWIPCSERLPEDSGDYLVRPSDSVLEDYSDFCEVMIIPYDADCEAFGWWTDRYDPISLGYVDSDFNEFDVLAWMPLPEPWKGADDDY